MDIGNQNNPTSVESSSHDASHGKHTTHNAQKPAEQLTMVSHLSWPLYAISNNATDVMMPISTGEL